MNTLLRINIKVAVQQANEIAKVTEQLKKAKAAMSGFGGAGSSSVSGINAQTDAFRLQKRQLDEINKALRLYSTAVKIPSKNLEGFKVPQINRNLSMFSTSKIIKQGQAEAAAAARAEMKQAQEVANAKAKHAQTIANLNRTLATRQAQDTQKALNAEVQMHRDAVTRISQIRQSATAGLVSPGAARVGVNAALRSSEMAVTPRTTREHQRATHAAGLALAQFEKQETAANKAAAALNGGLDRQRASLLNVGRQIQWTGRQLEYTFTLPALAAGTVIYEMQKATNAAATDLVKVYGDAGEAADRLSTKTIELGIALKNVNRGEMSEAERVSYDLGRGFRVLSDHFGVAIEEVTKLGAAWAAAGAEGAELADATRLTLEAMTIGEFESQEEAFRSLIAIQQAFGLSIGETREALSLLNAVENATAIRFADLVDVIARAGSTAVAAGVSLEELAGIAAILVPGTGTGEAAGNSIKTIISRILVPTEAGIEALQALGVEVDSIAYQEMNAADRMLVIAEAWNQATDAQKQQTSVLIAGRYQLNRFDTMMNDATKEMGKYQTALGAIRQAQNEAGGSLTSYNREINTLLQSDSRAIDIMTNKLKNTASAILTSLLPAVASAAEFFAGLAEQFQKLDPGIQKIILIGVVSVVALGPILRVGGAILQLFGLVGSFVSFLQKAGIFAALANPYVLAAAAIIGAGVAIWVYRDEIVAGLTAIWNYLKPWADKLREGLGRVWNALPTVVQTALQNVWNTIKRFGKAIWEALQALNPFKRHSPSLVDNVIAGVDIIAGKYASLGNIGVVFRRAAADIAAFGAATKDLVATDTASKRDEVRANVQAVAPEAMPALDNLFQSQDMLKSSMSDVQAEIDAQQVVVDQLDKEYKSLSQSIDIANAALSEQRELASALKEQLDAASAELDRFARAPIEGMGAMSDAMFENEMAQKRLRLAMMDLEDANGPIETVRNQLALLAGEIETLAGLEADLRGAGAGSEVTGPIRERIKTLDQESRAIKRQIEPYNDLAEQLKNLERVGERLDLENSIKFDPLLRQIESLSETIQELPFDVIVAGIKANKTKVDDLTKSYEDAQARVAQHELKVKDLEQARTDLSLAMDIEKGKLTDLEGTYKALESQLQTIESALGDITSAAQSAGDAMGGVGGGGGPESDFTSEPFDPAAFGFPTEEELKAMIDGWIKEFDIDIDPFKGIKAKWAAFKKWWDQNVYIDWGKLFILLFPWVAVVKLALDDLGISWDELTAAINRLWEKMKAFVRWSGWDSFKKLFSSVMRASGEAAGLFGEKFKETWDIIVERFEKSDLIQAFGRTWGNVMDDMGFALKVFVAVVGPYVAAAWEQVKWFNEHLAEGIDKLSPVFLGAWGWMWDRFNNILGPALDIAIGLIKFFSGFFLQDQKLMEEGINQIWSGIKEMVGVIWGGIKDKVIEWVTKIKIEALKLWEEVRDAAVEKWEEIKRLVSEKIGDIKTWIGEQIEPLREKARELARAILTAIRDYFTQGDATMAVVGAIESGLRSVVNALLSQVERGINKFIGAFNDVAALPDISYIRIDRIERFHNGGLVGGVPGTEVPAILQAGEFVLRRSAVEALNDPKAILKSGTGNSTKVMNFNGDLSFPNVTDGDDAEKFIRNLEALAV